MAKSSKPIIQITIVEPEAGKMEEALALMEKRARFMASQPGFISIALHRSVDGRRIVNYVEWQDRDMLKAAHQSPEFRKEWTEFDKMTDDIDRHLYTIAHEENRMAAA